MAYCCLLAGLTEESSRSNASPPALLVRILVQLWSPAHRSPL